MNPSDGIVAEICQADFRTSLHPVPVGQQPVPCIIGIGVVLGSCSPACCRMNALGLCQVADEVILTVLSVRPA